MKYALAHVSLYALFRWLYLPKHKCKWTFDTWDHFKNVVCFFQLAKQDLGIILFCWHLCFYWYNSIWAYFSQFLSFSCLPVIHQRLHHSSTRYHQWILMPMAAQRYFCHEDEVQMKKNVLQGSGLDQHVLLVSSVSRVLLFFQQVNRWIHALWQVVLVLPRLVLRSISDCHTVESIGESRDVNEKSMPHMEGRQGNGETSNVCMCVSAGQGTTTTLKR